MHNNDNIEASYGTSASTGLGLVLNLKNMTASLNHKLYNPQNMAYAVSQGSYQSIGQNGHVLIGRGAVPHIEEYNADGEIVMTYTYGTEETVQTYRAYRSVWNATPRTRPSIYACHTTKNQTIVYAS